MEILVIVALVVVVAAVSLRQWYRKRQGKATGDGAEGKTQQMNDLHRERGQDDS